MNPFILSFSDGTIFFVGLTIVFLAEALLFCFHNRLTRPLFTVVAVMGILLMIISATPLPLWAYAVWAVPAGAGLIILNRSTRPRWLCLLCGLALAISTLALCLAEAPFHFRPSIRVAPQATVYVLGDSISAGIGKSERPWPVVLNEMTDFQVVNLARAGATVESAITQARKIDKQPSLVILAVGGNDLLGVTDATTFHAALDRLVASLRAGQNTVLLLELPLFPFQNAFGRAQRDVAREHGCAMLPKRSFTRVLGTQKGTIDGLHLSQAGHNAMAATIADLLKKQ